MADQKITDLAALASAEGSDLLAIVDDPAGAPATKKITVANLFGSFLEYGGIYVDDGVVTQSGIPAAMTKLTMYTGNASSTTGITPDHTTDRVLVAHDGDYYIFFQISCTGTPNKTFEAHVHVNGVQQDEIGCTRKFGAGGDVGSTSCMGIVSVGAGQAIDVRAANVGAGTIDLTMIESQLMVLRVG